MENSQFNRPSYQQQQQQQHQYPQRTLSPSNSRDMYMTSNTVPVYRHGRKYYVSVEESERMRAEERRNRRTVMQKSQNLPISKSQSINYRTPLTSSYNSVNRSTSNPHEHRYGILRTPHLPLNSNTITNNNNTNNFNRHESTRQSRSTFRYYDERDDISIPTFTLPMKTSTTAIRSNSSDKVLDLRKTPQLSVSPYPDYMPDDYELKRSISAEIVHPTEVEQQQQPQVVPRRKLPPPVSDYGMSTVSAYPITSTDPMYNQTNTLKLPSYFNRTQPPPPPPTLNSPIKTSVSTFTAPNSTYDTDIQDSDDMYSVVNPSNRRNTSGSTTIISRSPTNNNTNKDYYFRDTTNGSLSDDNSSSPTMLNQRRNIDNNRYRQTQLVVETKDDSRRQNDIWPRSTARSHSTDGFIEKKRVRFADMEGYTLETVSDVEQQQQQQRRSPMNNRSLTRPSHGQTTSSHFQEEIQPFHNAYYQTATRVGNSGSKLATDV